MASAHAHSQLARLPLPASGASVKATLSATVDWLGSTRDEPDDRGVDPQRALALEEQRQVLVVAVGGRAGRAVLRQQVDVVGEDRLPLRAVELRLPVLVEPARAVGVRHGRQEGHVLAPAGLAAQADAVDVVVGVVHRRRGRLDVVPGRAVRDSDARGLGQVRAVVDEGGLAVEGHGVELAVRRQAGPDRRAAGRRRRIRAGRSSSGTSQPCLAQIGTS